MIIFNILFICNCTLYSYILALKLCDILNFRPKPIMPHTYKQKTDRASTPLVDISLKAVTTAKENGVVMLTVPPHTSHRSQPLDKTVYGPLKTYIFRAMDGCMRTHPGRTVSNYKVAELVKQAFMSAMTPINITSGFRSTGIYILIHKKCTKSVFCLESIYGSREIMFHVKLV